MKQVQIQNCTTPQKIVNYLSIYLSNTYLSIYLKIHSYSVVCVCDDADGNAELDDPAEDSEPNSVLYHEHAILLPPVLKYKPLTGCLTVCIQVC